MKSPFQVTPDEDFVLDKHPKLENIAIGAGFSGEKNKYQLRKCTKYQYLFYCTGHGFKFASVVGEILGSFLLKRQTPFDLSMFRIDRFKWKDESIRKFDRFEKIEKEESIRKLSGFISSNVHSEQWSRSLFQLPEFLVPVKIYEPRKQKTRHKRKRPNWNLYLARS